MDFYRTKPLAAAALDAVIAKALDTATFS